MDYDYLTRVCAQHNVNHSNSQGGFVLSEVSSEASQALKSLNASALARGVQCRCTAGVPVVDATDGRDPSAKKITE